MKHLFLLTLTAAGTLFGGEGKSVGDPLADAFIPPEVAVIAGPQVGLSPELRQAIRTRMETAQSRAEEWRSQLERETSALAALARKDRIDEAALLSQLDKVLAAERELKRLHLGLLVALKNELTPEQQARLREIARSSGGRPAEEIRRRLTEKVERVQQLARKWAESGRDPAPIARTMEEKVRPLIEAANPLEAERELDRLLAQLGKAGE